MNSLPLFNENLPKPTNHILGLFKALNLQLLNSSILKDAVIITSV